MPRATFPDQYLKQHDVLKILKKFFPNHTFEVKHRHGQYIVKIPAELTERQKAEIKRKQQKMYEKTHLQLGDGTEQGQEYEEESGEPSQS